MIKVYIDENLVEIEINKIKYKDFLVLKEYEFNKNNNIDKVQSYNKCNFDIFSEIILKVAYQESIDVSIINIDNISFINLDLKFFCLPSLLDIEDEYILKITNILKLLFLQYLSDDSIYNNYVIERISFKKFDNGIIRSFLPPFYTYSNSLKESNFLFDLDNSIINSNKIINNSNRRILNIYENYDNYYAESKFIIEYLFFKKVKQKVCIEDIKIVEMLNGKRYNCMFDINEKSSFNNLVLNIILEIINTKDIYSEIQEYEDYAVTSYLTTNYFCFADVIIEMKIV